MNDRRLNWQDLAAWLILTVACGGFGLPLAFLNWQTILVAFLVYLPLTAGIVWLTVYRNKLWFGLWFLVFGGWLTYIGPFVAAVFDQIPIGDTF